MKYNVRIKSKIQSFRSDKIKQIMCLKKGFKQRYVSNDYEAKNVVDF
ncbi:hypothetical protein GCM10008119_12850 [Pedobacter mendelii]|uniref:Transposase n=1 Tax=Pedobacter mendelii TaxID=1908240 RepID=A0ABQ2BEX5_9SPHI|nr:hypothetical protein GCM10008119_12850 [Pedobacter mendelii]